MTTRLLHEETPVSTNLLTQVRRLSRPLRSGRDLDGLINLIADARFVLLGEASHGTAEYYLWRTEISRRLIVEKGFRFIAVEGDWPDCYRVNRFVRGLPGSDETARAALHGFERWPTWMWANHEVLELIEWLRAHNDDQALDQKVGFYGLDVYSLWQSLYAVMAYLARYDRSALPAARRALRCFEPYAENAQEYARATRFVPHSCEREVVELLHEVRSRTLHYDDARDSNVRQSQEDHFAAEQNAVVLRNAEAYYRAMIHGGPDSWNVRDRHMTETLNRLVDHLGPDAKAIVWEHNTHIGDARFTDMAKIGEVNVGQLVRAQHAEEGVVLVGFGSHSGTVIAGQEWDAPQEVMQVPPAREASWEDVLHTAAPADRMLLLKDADPTRELLQPRGHRAIGVVYHPAYERYGNYVPTVLSRRYDAFLFLDKTQALRPLRDVYPHANRDLPETYPSGL